MDCANPTPSSLIGALAERGVPNVDFRDPQPLIEVGDAEALDFVTGLVDPDPTRRACAQKLAPLSRGRGTMGSSCPEKNKSLDLREDNRRTKGGLKG